ncbi:FG-GAP repeat protein [Planctomycetes bacterium Pla163]|uniref:FG-GAP repeat protein n=1 Tax=Rohdeia mirabilis TaxID=2528008 RepID=A0A518D2V8_9BACT|nr:FG-GAP repeat protein [Planctomycetes bacterium Pla163]
MLAPTLALALLAPTSLQQAEVETLGGGTAGFASQPRLAIDGAPLVGKPFGLRITHAPANSVGVIAASATASPVPLPEFGATAHPLPPYFALAVVGTDAHGESPVILALANVPAAYVGVEFHTQGLVADPGAAGSLAFTAARTIRMGDSDGALDFLGPQIPLTRGASVIVVADVDADGAVDLITTSRGDDFGDPDRVEVRLGDGTGSYGAPNFFDAADDRVTNVLTADFDRDGHLDLLLDYVNFFGPDADYSVHLGAGDGTFTSLGGVSFGQTSGADFLAVAMIGGDGYPDLLMRGAQGVEVHEGLGDGTFAPWASPAFPTAPRGLRGGDLNGDRRLDLVVAVAAFPTGPLDVFVLLGDGNGAFTQSATFPPFSSSPWPSFDLADVDGDNVLDLLVFGTMGQAVDDAQSLVVRLGVGDGTFGPEIPNVDVAPYGIFLPEIRDLDGDGNCDLFFQASIVQYALGNGDGTFAPAAVHARPVAGSAQVPADVDGDGHFDVLISYPDAPSILVLRGLAGAQLDAPTPNPWAGLVDLAVGDLDRDGVDDLVSVAEALTLSPVRVLLGGGDGTFELSFEGTAGFDAKAVELADLDQDGSLDIVVANHESDSVSIFLGNGDGTASGPIHFAMGDGPWRLAVGDVDGDGVADVLTTNRNSDDVTYRLGLGDGTFASVISIPAGDRPYGLGLADLDGDGASDLVYTNEPTDTLTVRLGTGGGSFGPAVVRPVGDSPHLVEIVDLDEDGHLDVLVANRYSDDLYVHLGVGDGSLADPAVHDVGSWPVRVSTVDADRDGILDLVVWDGGSTPDEAAVVWLRGTRQGELAAAESLLDPGWDVIGDATIDADGDGMPDLVVVHAFGALGVVMLRNRLFE